MMSRKALIEQFKALDTDGSGQVDVAELLKLMPGADQEAANNILAAMDRDLNGTISLEEYIQWCSPSDENAQNDNVNSSGKDEQPK